MTVRQILLILVAVLLAVIASEGLLRISLDPGRLYSSLYTQPEWNAWKNRVQFWHERRDRKIDPFPGFDPLLGWDVGKPQRFRDSPAPRMDANRTLIAIGDSFTFGTDVEAHENFPFHLSEMLPDASVLNMAVPGYGIDQAYLKYLHYGEQHDPEVVIFGIYVGDYERTSSAFTAYAKPLFVVDSDGVRLTNQPVTEPVDLLTQTELDFAGRWYVVELVANAWRKYRSSGSTADYYDATDRIIEHLLASLKARLDGDARLVIVHIPRAEAFVERIARRDEMSRRLLAIYARLELDVVNLKEAFATPEDAYLTYYTHFDDGSAGHLSAAGNQRVAELIARKLGSAKLGSE